LFNKFIDGSLYNFDGHFYDNGKKYVKIFKHKNKPKLIKKNKKIYEKQLEVYNKFYPKILYEISGIADALGMDTEKLIQFMITPFKIDGCSIFSYNGLIGRNYDWLTNSIDTIEIFRVKTPNLYSFLCINDGTSVKSTKKDKDGFYIIEQYIDTICGDDYINEKFLYIGILFSYVKKNTIGLTCLHFMRRIAELCKNIDEVLKYMKEVPCATPKFYFVSDKSGKSIVIEHFGGTDYRVLHSSSCLLIHTNHVLDKQYIKYDNKKTRKESIERYNTIKTLCRKNKPKTLIEIKTILDDDKVFAMYKGREATVYQLLMDMRNKKIYFCWKHKIYKLKL